MSKRDARAEMPFLEHLEELRWRIIWSALALIVGSLIGFYVVQHYDVLALLKRPIAQLLPEGKLFVTRPTDAFIITLKLAVLVGIVLSSPVVIFQAWAFLSPALYERERKFMVPALIAGLLLFIGGGLMAYFWVLPTALRLLFSFQRADLEFIITATEYFSFASLFILAFGLVFELPLVIVLLAAFGIVDPAFFAKHRPIAWVLGASAAALLTPPDAFSMLMMLAPLMLLYEVGITVARLLWRGQRRRGGTLATVILLCLLGVGRGEAQQPGAPPPRPPVADTSLADSLRQPQPTDTASARRLGLPTAPSRTFPSADSVIQNMLKREGFHATRYAGDTLTLRAQEKEIELAGSALVEREGSTLEADSVTFFQAECRLTANGEPRLFDRGTVLVGEDMRYDTCEERGIVAKALTSFQQSGVEWYLRGALAVDSASTRIYAGGSGITSCDLPSPHYHFQAGKVKWVTNTILVARPAVLYVKDVPVLWLPFIFQDMRQGRRTGLLVPRFGINDLVRPNRGYQRHVTNVGFYVALNDYMDVETSLDWYSGRNVQLNGQFRYRWLDRFVRGGINVSRLYDTGGEEGTGSRSTRFAWAHQQDFNLRTHLTASIDYVTSARILQRNAVDPNLAKATLGSRVNFNKQYDWGTFTLGGTRSQDLTNGLVTQTLPSLTLTPQPIDLASWLTWSPSVVLNNQQTMKQPAGVIALPPVNGVPQTDSLFLNSRTTTMSLGTPLRIGGWNWTNSIAVNDRRSDRRSELTLPDPTNPQDSVVRFYGEDYSTGIDWSTSIGLPVLFPATWRLSPSIGIQNSTGGEFFLRNIYTGGRFVHQGKRLSFGASISPTIFGFFPGFGPLLRIRHAVSPSVQWTYAPSASVPEEYARALNPTGDLMTRSDPVHSITLSLSQTFEAKLKPAAGDTVTEQNPRKIKLLSIQTGGVTYNFEQAAKPGRNGWSTSTLTNTFTSDLLPGFTLAMTHDLFRGAVGTDTAVFSPFLTRVSTRFSLTGSTLARFLALLTGGPQPPAAPAGGPAPPPYGGPGGLQPGEQGPLGPTTTGIGGAESAVGMTQPGQGLTLSVSYDDQRSRPTTTTATLPGGQTGSPVLGPAANRTLGLMTGFSPTRDWSLSWSTQYNFTSKEFGEHQLRLERNLHRWRATFAFVKSPNGNFAFNFYINLLDQPDIKFQYDQRTIK